MEFCKEFIAETQDRLTGWKRKSLSHVGRETLIKSSLSSLPSYHMSTTHMAKNVCHKLDSLNRDFWWGFRDGNVGIVPH